MPKLRYPDGYRVEVNGPVVTSSPCAERLTLRDRSAASEVRLIVLPGGPCA